MPSEQLIQNEARHAVFVNRYAGGLSNDFLPYLERLKKEISFVLNSDSETNFTRTRMNVMLREINKIQRGIYSEYEEALLEQLELFSEHEIDFEFDSMESINHSATASFAKPAPAQVWAAAVSSPLVFPDSNDVVLLKSFISGWTEREVKRVTGIINTGFALGETTQQIARKIAGKKGSLDVATRRASRAIARTATNHVSSVAREKMMMENDDIIVGYRWVSTLDSRTSSQCKSLDGREFKWTDKYKPLPPIHISCRSATVPVLDERFNFDRSNRTRASKGDEGGKQIAADTTYYSFLKNQSKAFQDETLGKTRGRLFRNGGLTSEEFAKLTVDQKFRPLNLKEMREKAPLVFEQAGL
tara:strand:+ start:5642 stop:6715 length:1074 start_codon:yes stop_codon:yes gene_type:complete